MDDQHHEQAQYYYAETDPNVYVGGPYSSAPDAAHAGMSMQGPITGYVEVVDPPISMQNVPSSTLPQSLSPTDLSDMHMRSAVAQAHHHHHPQQQHPSLPHHIHTHQIHPHPSSRIDPSLQGYHQPQLSHHPQQGQIDPQSQQQQAGGIIYHPQSAHDLQQQHAHPQPSPSSSIPPSPPPASPGGPYDPLSPHSSASSTHSLSLQPQHHHQGALAGYSFPQTPIQGQTPMGHITPNTTPSSGAPSPSPTSSRSSSLVHRTHHGHMAVPSQPHARGHYTGGGPAGRYNPTSPTGRGPHGHGHGHKYRSSQSDENIYNSDVDDDILAHAGGVGSHGHGQGVDDMSPPPLGVAVHMVPTMSGGGGDYLSPGGENRKEATRRQRIEAEQRRRDDLREGYARLKDVLPITNQKSSKVSLLERAVNHIVHMSKVNEALQARIQAQDAEINRLRSINERIGLSSGSASPVPQHQQAQSQPMPVSIAIPILGVPRPPARSAPHGGGSESEGSVDSGLGSTGDNHHSLMAMAPPGVGRGGSMKLEDPNGLMKMEDMDVGVEIVGGENVPPDGGGGGGQHHPHHLGPPSAPLLHSHPHTHPMGSAVPTPTPTSVNVTATSGIGGGGE